MGERGPVPGDGTGDGHRTLAELDQREVFLRPVVIEHPVARPSWSVMTALAWEDYWRSYVAQAAETIDLPSLTRLFDLIDRQERMWEIVDDETGGTYTVTTERSGDKAHPLIASITQLDGMIDRLERQFGIRPLSRARLGLKGAAAAAAQAKIRESSQPKRGRVIDHGSPEQGPQ